MTIYTPSIVEFSRNMLLLKMFDVKSSQKIIKTLFKIVFLKGRFKVCQKIVFSAIKNLNKVLCSISIFYFKEFGLR
jgi:hypothetical protein